MSQKKRGSEAWKSWFGHDVTFTIFIAISLIIEAATEDLSIHLFQDSTYKLNHLGNNAFSVRKWQTYSAILIFHRLLTGRRNLNSV